MDDRRASLDFDERLATVAAEIEALLDELLTDKPLRHEIARPPRLLAAMRHAVLGGGKRLRPFLVAESAAMFDGPRSAALLVGAALECVHCYSLVHDDLPAMDNDDLRRGRPTVHKAFDEATAILAGDALLTFAFDILAVHPVHESDTARAFLITELARAAGMGGMAGGQMLDLEAEGRFGAAAMDENAILQMQEMKTGALLRYACGAGGVVGTCNEEEYDALSRYGIAVGRAFQIADDLLDVEGDPAAVGKKTGKDAAAGKATIVSRFGVAGAQAVLMSLLAEAESALATFGEKADVLREAARFIVERRR